MFFESSDPCHSLVQLLPLASTSESHRVESTRRLRERMAPCPPRTAVIYPSVEDPPVRNVDMSRDSGNSTSHQGRSRLDSRSLEYAWQPNTGCPGHVLTGKWTLPPWATTSRAGVKVIHDLSLSVPTHLHCRVQMLVHPSACLILADPPRNTTYLTEDPCRALF